MTQHQEEWVKELHSIIERHRLDVETYIEEEAEQDIVSMISTLLAKRDKAVVHKIKWWLFETGKFTNDELLEFKKEFLVQDTQKGSI